MNITSETIPEWLMPIKETPIDTYTRLGWKLIPVPAGTKGPRKAGWNRIENCYLPNDWSGNIGLALAYSGIVSIDIDHWLKAARWLADRGIDLDVLYQAPGAVKIDSGRQGRGKLLYRLPEGMQPLASEKITDDRECILEFRCATSNSLTVQDVLPPSIHPETQQPYQWVKPDHVDLFDYLAGMPTLPDDLLKVWQDRTAPREPVAANPDLSADWGQVQEALGYISADCSRDDWIRVGMGLHDAGVKSGSPDTGFYLWDQWSSQSPEKYPGQNDLATQWRSFKPDNGVTLGTLFHIAAENGYRKSVDAATLFADVAASRETPSSAPISFEQFTLNGKSKEMRAKMLTDTFVLGRLAILGQSTLIFAKPNAGKTLLTLWLLIDAIEKQQVNGSDIFYVNADDYYRALVEKLELAERHGFQYMAPGHEGLKHETVTEIVRQMIESGQARGRVLILDTLKKFMDLMRKDKASAFGEVIRQFVMHGGTVISLAHVNKHRAEDGKVIYSGTSDSVDDADCAYTLDIVSDDKATGLRTVKFENIKARGDVAMEAVYQYDASTGRSYLERLKSVRQPSEDETSTAEYLRRQTERYERNREAIVSILELLREGVVIKSELVKAAMDRSGLSRRQILKALTEHAGTNTDQHEYWICQRGDKNSHVYFPNY